jgi:hypothetical protein
MNFGIIVRVIEQAEFHCRANPLTSLRQPALNLPSHPMYLARTADRKRPPTPAGDQELEPNLIVLPQKLHHGDRSHRARNRMGRN